MYARTNAGAGRLPARQKRFLAVAGVAIIAALGGLAAWGALAPDRYGASGHGCVNVTVPSSTGGATLHYCGPAARSFCLTAFRAQDKISVRARPQCVLAGLSPRPGTSSGP